MDDRRTDMVDRIGNASWGRGQTLSSGLLSPCSKPQRRYMKYFAVGLSLLCSFSAGRVEAIPGQTLDEAVVWIRANSTLRPVRSERLLVRKSDTPAQRFTFWASPLQVGRAAPGARGGVIRTEEISFFDMQNGVSRDRLQESLRVIYGPTIYQDYTQAKRIYTYPVAQANDAMNRRGSLTSALQGEVREGDQYAYWLEIAQQQNGFPYIGKITVFLKDDLPKLEAELRQRSN